jgi:hypothetical protein
VDAAGAEKKILNYFPSCLAINSRIAGTRVVGTSMTV